MLKLLEQLILLFPQMMNALLAYFLQAIKVPAVLPVYKDPAVLPVSKALAAYGDIKVTADFKVLRDLAV